MKNLLLVWTISGFDLILLLAALYTVNHLIVAATRGFSFYNSCHNPRKRFSRWEWMRNLMFKPGTYVPAGLLTSGEYLYFYLLIG